jgi:hypothetical protein
VSKKSLLQDKYFADAERVVSLITQSEIKQREQAAYDRGYRRGYILSAIFLFIGMVVYSIIKAWLGS